MHGQMTFALGSASKYLVRDREERSSEEWLLFIRTVGGTFLDYRTSADQFKWRFYNGLSSLALTLDNEEECFLRFPGEVVERDGPDREIIHPDYLWMHEDSDNGLVLVDFKAVNPITFWNYLTSRKLDKV